jgi:hypothetical protein
MIPPKPISPDPRVYRPRRKPVTIAVGFAYDSGLLFCADTKITTNIKTDESKITVLRSDDGLCCMTFAISSDDINFPQSAISACWDLVNQMNFATSTMDAVHNTAEFSLAEFYRDHIYPHPDRTPDAVFLEILVGIWLRGETRLYVSHETLLTPVEDYECVGSGAYLAKYLIQQYHQANPRAHTLEDTAIMASFAVQSAIDYDEHCGGNPELLIITNSGECTNAYHTAAYPSDELIKQLQLETWRLLHNLAHVEDGSMEIDTALQLEEHFERVRQINKSYQYVFDMKSLISKQDKH